MNYIFWFFFIALSVAGGLLLAIFLGVNMTRRQAMKEQLKKLAHKVGSYIATHVDEAEKKRLLEIVDDNRLSAGELIEVIRIMLSPNKPATPASSGTEPYKAEPRA